MSKSFLVFADDNPIQIPHKDHFSESIHKKSLDVAMDHFKKILQDAKKDGYFNEQNNIPRNEILKKQKNQRFKKRQSDNTKILVFVSTSMPKELLKNYYKEAEIYGASLVFNGLPDGGFRGLRDLITELDESVSKQPLKRRGGANGASALIDDEMFKKFGISKAPTFVLVKEQDPFRLKKERSSFDKLEGNVGLRYALEKFSEEGDLRFEAKEYLQ